jgi:zinc transport system substrate-binding protein
MKRIIFLLLCFLIFSVVACQDIDSKDRINIAVSIAPQKTFVKAVGGEFVDVITMIPPGNSTGNYEPSPRELSKFSDSCVYFSMGVPADMANILPRAKEFNNEMRIVKVFNEVSKLYKDREFAPGNRDPHIWLSPKRVILMIDTISHELSIIDEENRKVYEENAREYKNKLIELDQYIKNSLSRCANRTFIIFHPSFGYFADDYGLEMLAIEKDGKEATAKGLKEIINKAKKKGLEFVLNQKEINSKQSDAIAEELGAKIIQIEPLAENYIENLYKTVEIFKRIMECEIDESY